MPRAALIAACLCIGLVIDAHAQTSVGVHSSVLANRYPDETVYGAGGFLTHMRGPVGIDVATTLFFPHGLGDFLWQVLAGPRAGVTWRDVGVYGRARVGFGRFSQRFFKPGIACVAIFPIPEACLADQTNLQLDLGGTVEVGVSPAAKVRFDLGDTSTRYSGAPPDAQWQHGLQVTAGVGFTF